MIRGYDNLSDSDKALFNAFSEVYRRANGSDVDIQFTAVRRESNYLRVDMIKNGRKTWQQVLSSTTWG